MWSDSLTIYDSAQDIADRLDAESEEGMERLTEIKTHVTGFSYTDKKEGIFAQNVYAKLAAYEDTGLTPKQIQEQQRYIKALEKQVEVEGQQAIIEAQQQEINLLIMEITELRESNQALKDYAENAEAAKTALAYRVMLERLEWVDNDYCPICGQYKANGHANDCELVALLKESEVEEG